MTNGNGPANRRETGGRTLKRKAAPALDDAFGRIQSFIDARVKRLLVVEDDAAQREAIVSSRISGSEVRRTRWA